MWPWSKSDENSLSGRCQGNVFIFVTHKIPMIRITHDDILPLETYENFRNFHSFWNNYSIYSVNAQ